MEVRMDKKVSWNAGVWSIFVVENQKNTNYIDFVFFIQLKFKNYADWAQLNQKRGMLFLIYKQQIIESIKAKTIRSLEYHVSDS